MTPEMTVQGAMWFPHHFLGDTPCLGRDGVIFEQWHGDCAGAALKMIFNHFDVSMEYRLLWQRLQDAPEGATMLSLKEVAEAEGLICEGWRLAPPDLLEIPLPAVLLLNRSHFAVVTHADPAKGIEILDPVRGRLLVSTRRLVSVWNGETLLFHKQGTTPEKQKRWFAR